jgi:type II secretory pathway component PulF
MSYKAEFLADRTGSWVSNQLRFATEQEARAYLASRRIAVLDTRVVESDEPVNCTYDKGATEMKKE